VAAVPTVLGQLHELRDQLLDTTVNDRQRRNLARSLDNHLIATRNNVARHAARSAALDQARIADPRTDSDQAAAMLSNAASSIWRSAIEGALAKDDTKPAIALHDLPDVTASPLPPPRLPREVCSNDFADLHQAAGFLHPPA
jgi:hypothetical protein